MANKKKAEKVVIVRTYSAGVNVGTLVSRDGKEVTLRDSHKIWRWRGAETLHELAANGAHMSEYTRISKASPGEVVVTEMIEMLDVTDPAVILNLTTARWLS
jgi:hypothetical protein